MGFAPLRFCVLVVVSCAAVFPAVASVPGIVNFQGMLEDDQGTLLDGTFSVTFSIYDQESGGSALWSETRNVDCTAGLFSILLGQDTPIALSFDTQYWLGIQVVGDPEMTPRYALASVPYAFWSATADSSMTAARAASAAASDYASVAAVCDSAQKAAQADVADESLTAAVSDSANGVLWGNISGVPPDLADGDDVGGAGDGYSLDAADGSPVDALYVDNFGNVGIATTSPAQKLHVQSDARVDGTLKVTGFQMQSGASNGHVLTSNGSGVGTWQAPAGGGDGDWTISGNDLYSAVSGNIGIGTASPAAKLDVRGSLDVGQDGSGYDVNLYGSNVGRLFWDSDEKALRAGFALSDNWSPDSVGLYSVAMGYDTRAIGNSAVALGSLSAARGNVSFAAGAASKAFGEYSVAIGRSCEALASHSVAIGRSCEALGEYGVAMGEYAKADELAASAIGSHAWASGQYSRAEGRFVWASASSAHVIGTGLGLTEPLPNHTANSLMIGFNSDTPTVFVGPSSGTGTTGKVGIGTSTPDNEAKLSVQCASDNFGVLVNSDNTSGSEIGLHAANSLYSSLAKNCYFTGGSWHRNNESHGAYVNEITPDGHVWFKTVGSGAGAISWTIGLALKSNGDVGVGTNNPARALHVSDVMRLQPRASAPGSASEGDLYVNSSDHHIYCYLNGTWEVLD